jgi:hypothetical protein
MTSFSQPSDLATRRVRVADCDLVFVRSVLEAYDGLTQWSGDASGVLTLQTAESRAAELDALLIDLAGEVALQVLRD